MKLASDHFTDVGKMVIKRNRLVSPTPVAKVVNALATVIENWSASFFRSLALANRVKHTGPKAVGSSPTGGIGLAT